MWELTREFRFESAHTLRRTVDAEESLRVHGHSYRALVTVRGRPEPATGMLIDLKLFEDALAQVRSGLDHRLLDEVPDLGPATLESLCAWIWRRLDGALTDLHRVEVLRDSQGDRCSYDGRADGRR